MGFIDRAPAPTPRLRPAPRHPLALALEPRLMFDGAAAATVADAASSDAGTPPPTEAPSPDTASHDTQPDSRTDVAIVDGGVEGYEALAEAARAAGMEVIVVSGDDDGFGAVVDALQGRTDIDGLHILSHGGVGMVQIGDDVLSSNTLDGASDLLTVISGSLSEDGDLLLYGCRVGEGDAGRDFIESLAIRTGADVAASDDATGADALGGDWDLEVTRGTIDATPWAAGVEGFDGVLAYSGTITFDSASTSGASGSGDANDNATYTFSGGNYTLVLDGASESTYIYVFNGDGYGNIGGNRATETKATLSFQGGETFDISSINLTNYGAHVETFIITSDKAGDYYKTGAISNGNSQNATLTGFTGISKLYIVAQDGTIENAEIDNIAIANLQAAAASNDPVFTVHDNGSVSETATNNTVVLADGAIQANDGDGGGADVGITYSITAGNGNADGDGNAAFAINASTGEITVNDADDLDFETTGSYTLTIRADDGGGTVETDVTITVTNQAPVITSGQSFSVNESDTNTTVLGTVANTGDDDSVTFSIQSGNTGNAFAINASTGQITVNDTTQLDASATSSYTLVIRASDGTTNSDVNVSVTVTDDVAPKVSSVSSTTDNGTYGIGDTIDITVTFDEAVTVTGTPQLTLDTGTTDRDAVYLSGTGTNTLTFRYTVQAGDTSADLDYVSTAALALNGGTIKDAAGNNATLTLPTPGIANSLGANKALLIDGVSPTVSSVSSSTSNGLYGIGDTIDITVTFSEAVTVTGGTPQLTLKTDTTDRVVNYTSGNGTNTLTFSYTVQAGDSSFDLDYTGTTALTLNGSTIKDAAGNDATLTLPAPGTADSLGDNKDLEIDGTAPTVSAVSSSSANGTYGIGDTIDITVTFSEVVTVTDTPQLTLETGATDRVVDYTSGSGSNTLTFRYTVQAGDTSDDLDYLSTAALALNGGTIKDAAGNDATLTLATPGAANSLGANKALVIDAAVPTVTAVSATTADGAYQAGDPIDVTVTFSEAVTVATGGGTPTLMLETGTTDRAATYLSGSGTSTLTFRYTVQAGDTSADLDYTGTGALALNGGTIKDSGGNDALLTLATPGAANSLGANKAVVVDTAPSKVTSVSATTADGAYKAGEPIDVTVSFDEAVTVTTGGGTPTLTLETGATDRTATYLSGSGTSTLTFRYTVQAGDVSADLDYTGTGALTLNGGTIKDAAGNDATLTLATPGAATSLGASKALVVDTTPPGTATASGPLSVVEAAATGAAVGTVTAVDATSFTLADDAGGRFAISAGGAVTVANGTLLDFETATSHTITVRATDAAGNTTDTVLTVTVTDVDETTPSEAPEPSTPRTTRNQTPAPPPPTAPPLPANDGGVGGSSGSPIVTVIRPPASDGAGGGGAVGGPGDGGFSPTTPPLGTGTVIVVGSTASTGGSFPIVVIDRGGFSPGTEALVALRPVMQVFEAGLTGQIAFTLPSDTFAHTDGGALVQLNALQADGEPLPDWLTFDPASGTFVGKPPAGETGELVVQVIARDQAGREAAVQVRINLRPGGQADASGVIPGVERDGPARVAANDIANDAVAPPPAKPAFMAELRQARAGMVQQQSAALLALARDHERGR